MLLPNSKEWKMLRYLDVFRLRYVKLLNNDFNVVVTLFKLRTMMLSYSTKSSIMELRFESDC